MKSNFAATAGAVLLAATAMAGCTRQEASDITVKRGLWGGLSVDTNAGLKFDASIARYFPITTGSHPIHIVASLPGDIPTSSKSDGTAYGVIKTKEGFPLQGNITIWVDLNKAREQGNKQAVLNFYLKNPPLKDEKSEEYLNRILTRLAMHSFDVVQAEYKEISVDKFGTSGPEVKSNLVQKLNKSFIEQGFNIVTTEDAVLSGINLGPVAESSNQQIGVQNLSKKVAGAQKDAVAARQDAQNSMALLTEDLIGRFKKAGIASEDLPQALCVYYMQNDAEFAKRNPTGCFGALGMK